jgi:hypothetical protein
MFVRHSDFIVWTRECPPLRWYVSYAPHLLIRPISFTPDVSTSFMPVVLGSTLIPEVCMPEVKSVQPWHELKLQ